LKGQIARPQAMRQQLILCNNWLFFAACRHRQRLMLLEYAFAAEVD
jgi:hypothetical protein